MVPAACDRAPPPRDTASAAPHLASALHLESQRMGWTHRGCLSMRHAADEAHLLQRMHGRACCKRLHSDNQCIFGGLHACSRVQRHGQCVTEAPSGRTHPLVSSLCFHTCVASGARRTSPTASTSPHSLPVSCTRAASTARARSGASMTCQADPRARCARAQYTWQQREDGGHDLGFHCGRSGNILALYAAPIGDFVVIGARPGRRRLGRPVRPLHPPTARRARGPPRPPPRRHRGPRPARAWRAAAIG